MKPKHKYDVWYQVTAFDGEIHRFLGKIESPSFRAAANKALAIVKAKTASSPCETWEVVSIIYNEE